MGKVVVSLDFSGRECAQCVFLRVVENEKDEVTIELEGFCTFYGVQLKQTKTKTGKDVVRCKKCLAAEKLYEDMKKECFEAAVWKHIHGGDSDTPEVETVMTTTNSLTGDEIMYIDMAAAGVANIQRNGLPKADPALSETVVPSVRSSNKPVRGKK